jgi:N-methylhydantoinase A
MYRLGIDVGGTFTDLVAVDDSGCATLAKVPSTPSDPSLGVLDGLAHLAAELGTDLMALLARTDRIVHGTTVATNVLLERKGAKVGLLTTEGHRDVIEMREGLKSDRYNLRMRPPEQLVPRDRRIGVRERLRGDGRTEVQLDSASLARAIEKLRNDRVEAVAVCYFHSYRDARHERATAAALAEALPDSYVSLSSDVLPQIKEFQRVSTTVVNAYVGPTVSKYLHRLAHRLAEFGYAGPILVIQSHGGVAPIAEAARIAVGAVLSGPAGGVAGSRYAARLIGEHNVIPFDMGGTSTDISLIVEGEPTLAFERSVGGHRIALNSLEIVTLGAGGGSIARVDAGGILHVGPESAGANPGPACYGQGGAEATVTDANLVLGYLDPATFLGGRRHLDVAAAEAAIDRIAARLGINRLATAQGIHRVVNTNMAEGVRLVTVRRGVDPRRFAIFAFGGAAGLHITDVARQLDLPRMVVPRVAAVLSAWGMLATNLRFEVTRTHIGDAQRLDGAALKCMFEDMEAEGLARLRNSFDGPVRTRRSVDMRYGEQIFEINVPLDDVDWSLPDPLSRIVELFHRRHEELYTYALRDQESVLVNARTVVSGILPALPNEPPLSPAAPMPPQAQRQIWLEGWVKVPVYRFNELSPSQIVSGPAIVESTMTTILLRPGELATVTSLGWLDIKVLAIGHT